MLLFLYTYLIIMLLTGKPAWDILMSVQAQLQLHYRLYFNTIQKIWYRSRGKWNLEFLSCGKCWRLNTCFHPTGTKIEILKFSAEQNLKKNLFGKYWNVFLQHYWSTQSISALPKLKCFISVWWNDLKCLVSKTGKSAADEHFISTLICICLWHTALW